MVFPVYTRNLVVSYISSYFIDELCSFGFLTNELTFQTDKIDHSGWAAEILFKSKHDILAIVEFW